MLAALALVDGLHDEEREVLLRTSAGLGLERGAAGAIVDEIASGGRVTNLEPPTDPAEKVNRIAEHPERAERMRDELAAHPSHTDIEQCPFTLDRPEPPTDAEQEDLEQKLRTLGYID